MPSSHDLIRPVQWADGATRLLDQTLLPAETTYKDCRTADEVWEAIVALRVRGAPAIGVAAGYGLVTSVWRSDARSGTELLAEVETAADYLATSRPTAVNLFWALDRMRGVARDRASESADVMRAALLAEAHAIYHEDDALCHAIGEHGAALVSDGETLLTHCNAGGLATSGYGTALAVMFSAHAQGKGISVYVDETRPLLQGARLTTWELMRAGIPCTLISDSAAAHVFAQGRVQRVVVGSDRIAANGDTANKIGTYGVAVLAKEHGIPFHVAAPTTSFDMSLEHGGLIPIEERAAEEVTEGFGRRTAPEGVDVYAPAFDVTPAKYITSIITERGVHLPPFTESLKADA